MKAVTLEENMAKADAAVNKLLVRTFSCELPRVRDTKTNKIHLDLSSLQADEDPRVNLPDGRAHPGRRLLGRKESPQSSPKGSPKVESRLHHSQTAEEILESLQTSKNATCSSESTTEEELSEENCSPIQQRRNTISE